ncbi:MAG: MFS transporter [Candidatus Sericytochromatia bacterium]|nr:MFS transporter [Candidatus Tanganyikabacteria bacterium]
MVADATSEDDRGKGMGIAGAAMGLGFVFGPAIGGLLAHGDDLQMPFFIASMVTGLTFVFATLVVDETRPEVPGAARRGLGFFAGMRTHGASLWPWLVLTFLQTAVFALMEATLALYARDLFGLRPRDVGMILALMGFVSALASGMAVGRLIRAFGEATTIKVGFTLFALGFATAPAAVSPAWLAASMVAVGVGMACMRPSLNSGVSKRAGEEIGSALGLMQSCDSLARVVGPALGGTLYVAAHALPFTTGAAVSVLALVFTILALPPASRPVAPPDTSSSHPQSA